jgi:ABC-type dipeptide/oligopeptide/nickel transport system permease component
MNNLMKGLSRFWASAGTLKFVLRRILVAIPVLFAITFVTFGIARAMPGNPFGNIGSRRVAPEIVARLEARFGLDKPFLLNMPGDSVAPDVGSSFVVEDLSKSPDCAKLAQGDTTRQTYSQTYEGWQLLRMVTEYRQTEVRIGGRSTACVQQVQVLYSDLFRSQYFQYMFNLLRGDLGFSIGQSTRGQLVGDLIGNRFPPSMVLGLTAVLIGFVIGIPLGVLGALRRNTWIDYVITSGVILFSSIPTLVLSPVLIYLLTVQTKIFTTTEPRAWININMLDPEFWRVALLPMLVLGVGISTGITRLTRASVLQVLRDDYIRTARSKGMRERRVIYIHGLKNALIPVVTVVGPLVAGALTGSLIIENIHGIPGMGNQFVSSVSQRDYTLMVGLTVLYSVFLISGNILVDVMYTWLDPRIRFD